MSAAGRGNLKMALSSIQATKWRSLLTILGVVIGVASVIVVIGIGQGLKKQVAGQIDHFGKDLIMIRPGAPSQYKQTAKHFVNSDVFFGRNAVGALTTQDASVVSSMSQISKSAPLGVVSSSAQADGNTLNDPLVIATSPQLPDVIGQTVRYGSFFSTSSDINTAVIGDQVSHELFGESVPLGRLFTMRGQTFMVQGIFSDFGSSPLSPTAGFDNAIFISYQAANQLTNNGLQFYAILAKPRDPNQEQTTMSALNSQLMSSHGGEQDFTVMNRTQTEDLGNNTISLLTTFISAVAAIALLVGGIGIMNIMLVSVTERIHEIGVRKAVGATNRQILSQFTLEAAVLSGTGGVIGIGVAVIIEMLLRTYSSYQPIITWQPIVLATLVSIFVGVIFGVAPALKAARKDPISALRHE